MLLYLNKIMRALLTIDARSYMFGLYLPLELMKDLIDTCARGLQCVHLPLLNMRMAKVVATKNIMEKYFFNNIELKPHWEKQTERDRR
jgi:hypothetical protein